jgi:hypothetical protein
MQQNSIHIQGAIIASGRGVSPVRSQRIIVLLSYLFEVIVRFKTVALVILSVLITVRPPVPLLAAPSPQLVPPGIQQPSPEDQGRAKIEKEMAKKANQERQADLKRDTEKLLKLATELKEYVDKTNENVLSLNVLKKAEQIEKLAHSVKDKMKGQN